MRLTVVGFGSIGQRHARLAAEMGHEVSLVTSQDSGSFPRAKKLQAALENFRPELLIISNRTSDHAQALKDARALGFNGPIMIEKPVSRSSAEGIGEDPNAYVAYNLRYHPVIESLKSKVAGQKIISAQLYVGQDLKTWRPGRDYRQSYSAKREEGGGVLRDLSHELDLIGHIMGPVDKVAALGGRRGQLEIDSEDCVSALIQTKGGTQVTLELNYLDRNVTRFINLNTEESTYRGDLISGILIENGEKKGFEVQRDLTYRAQLQDFTGQRRTICTLQEGKETVKLIEAIETSMGTGKWFVL